MATTERPETHGLCLLRHVRATTNKTRAWGGVSEFCGKAVRDGDVMSLSTILKYVILRHLCRTGGGIRTKLNIR